MVKSELIDKLARMEGITLRAAELAVDIAFKSMTEALAAQNRVEIRGFGSFRVKEYEEYTGRNPKSGEAISVRAKMLPAFRVGKELKERVDGKWEESI